eukprot:COSAG02_NODE_8684_length_2479_cov_3.227731_2_plen_778_part_01
MGRRMQASEEKRPLLTLRSRGEAWLRVKKVDGEFGALELQATDLEPHSGGLDGGGIVFLQSGQDGCSAGGRSTTSQAVPLACAAAATALTPRDEFPLAGLVFAGAAISGANADHQVTDLDVDWHRIYTMGTGQGGIGKVVSMADDNELFWNGISVATLDKGEIWTGNVNDFDEFYASGPIFGTVRDQTGGVRRGERTMASGRLKGKSFSFGNGERTVVRIWARALEADASCTVANIAGPVQARDIQAGTGHLFSFSSSASTTQVVNVVCSTNIVLAVAGDDPYIYSDADLNDRYIVVPPEGTEWYGIPSRRLQLSQSGPDTLEVTESCSDGSSRVITIPAGGFGAHSTGTDYVAHHSGKACVYSATEPFSAHSWSDSDGWDAVSMLPRPQGSTAFGIPTAFQWLAFASLEPGTCTCSHGTVQVSSCSNNVCRGWIGGSRAGATCDCTVPMWAAFDCSETNDEQLLYGDLSYQPAVEPDYILGSASTECMPGVEVELALPNGTLFNVEHSWDLQAHAGEQEWTVVSILDLTAPTVSNATLTPSGNMIAGPPSNLDACESVFIGPGAVLSLRFIVSEPLSTQPSVVIAGQSVRANCDRYDPVFCAASLEVRPDSPSGMVGYSIVGFADRSGNRGLDVIAETCITIDVDGPIFSEVSISADSLSTTFAGPGTWITLSAVSTPALALPDPILCFEDDFDGGTYSPDLWDANSLTGSISSRKLQPIAVQLGHSAVETADPSQDIDVGTCHRYGCGFHTRNGPLEPNRVIDGVEGPTPWSRAPT